MKNQWLNKKNVVVIEGKRIIQVDDTFLATWDFHAEIRKIMAEEINKQIERNR